MASRWSDLMAMAIGVAWVAAEMLIRASISSG
jgi:hypothetical protein